MAKLLFMIKMWNIHVDFCFEDINSKILLENAAGGGNKLAVTLDEIQTIISNGYFSKAPIGTHSELLVDQNAQDVTMDLSIRMLASKMPQPDGEAVLRSTTLT